MHSLDVLHAATNDSWDRVLMLLLLNRLLQLQPLLVQYIRV